MTGVTVSAVVCTRDRGDRLIPTIRSILSCEPAPDEIIVIDQSEADETEAALHTHFGDHRLLRLVRTGTRGTGVSRSLGLELASSDVVAFTDDDCRVPPQWVGAVRYAFGSGDPALAVAFGSVFAGPHDTRRGTVPWYAYRRSRLVDRAWRYVPGMGMGANMAVRRSLGLSLGGFDRMLGPGSPFRSGEDHDLAMRALVAGYHVAEEHRCVVIHDGFRTFEQFREVTMRDWFALGAVYSKLVRSRVPGVWVPLLFWLLYRGLAQPASMVLRWQRPRGFRRVIGFARGFTAGLRQRVDDHLRFTVPAGE